MAEKKQIYKCAACGNVVEVLHGGAGELVCCGEPMELLEGNTTDAAVEKHVPVVYEEDGKVIVKVGDVAHPMLPEHHIAWIYVELKDGGILKYLPVDQPACAAFDVALEDVKVVYEYCNLHGLWKKVL